MEQLVINLRNIDVETMIEVVDYLDEKMGNTLDGDVWQWVKY